MGEQCAPSTDLGFQKGLAAMREPAIPGEMRAFESFSYVSKLLANKGWTIEADRLCHHLSQRGFPIALEEGPPSHPITSLRHTTSAAAAAMGRIGYVICA
jgi:hypothetical protein